MQRVINSWTSRFFFKNIVPVKSKRKVSKLCDWPAPFSLRSAPTRRSEIFSAQSRLTRPTHPGAAHQANPLNLQPSVLIPFCLSSLKPCCLLGLFTQRHTTASSLQARHYMVNFVSVGKANVCLRVTADTFPVSFAANTHAADHCSSKQKGVGGSVYAEK